MGATKPKGIEDWFRSQDAAVEKVYKRMARTRRTKSAVADQPSSGPVTQDDLKRCLHIQDVLAMTARLSAQRVLAVHKRIKDGAEVEPGPFLMNENGLVEYRPDLCEDDDAT